MNSPSDRPPGGNRPQLDTTLAWIYEADPALDAHLHHVVSCRDCAAVLAEHEGVLHAVAPLATPLPVAANRASDARIRSRAFSPPRRPAVRAAPRRALPVGLALAAAALLAVGSWWLAPRPAPPAPPPVLAEAADPGFDLALDDLDADLASVALDLQDL